MTLDVRMEGPAQRVIVSSDVEGEIRASLLTGEEWVARPRDVDYAVVDPRAPVHQTVSYSDGADEVRVVRSPQIQTAFTSLDGKTLVGFKLSHEWTFPLRPNVSVWRGPGGAHVMHGPEVHHGPWQIRAVIAGADIALFEGLVASQQRVVMLHNRAWCQLPHCPCPDVIVGHVTGVAGEISGRKDVAQMIYRVEIDPIPVSRRLVVPAVSWGDVLDSGRSWADVEHLSWGELRDGV